MTKYNTICLIVAAGDGVRMQSPEQDIPKQYQKLANSPVLRHSAQAFIHNPKIDKVRIIFNPKHQELYDASVGDLDLLPPVAGGKTRQESVYLGLQSIAEFSPQNVLIHDAARPLVNDNIIFDVISGLTKSNAAIPAIALSDTLKKCTNGKIIETLPRENIFCAQTPQGFIYKEILETHEKAAKEPSPHPSPTGRGSFFTDDASIFEYFQKEVTIVPGSITNIKITNPEDFKIAEALLQQK